MPARPASLTDHSFHFGPRATGKATWLRQRPVGDFLALLSSDSF